MYVVDNKNKIEVSTNTHKHTWIAHEMITNRPKTDDKCLCGSHHLLSFFYNGYANIFSSKYTIRWKATQHNCSKKNWLPLLRGEMWIEERNEKEKQIHRTTRLRDYFIRMVVGFEINMASGERARLYGCGVIAYYPTVFLSSMLNRSR